MHFQGQQLISQATHVSSRTLVSISLAKIFSIWYGVNTSELEVLGLKLGEAFVALAPYFIGFLALNHLLSWLGDLHAFQSWNSAEKVSSESVWDAGSGKPLPTKLQNTLSHQVGVERALDEVKQLLDDCIGAEREAGRKLDLKKLQQLTEQTMTVAEKQTNNLQELLKRTEKLTLHAKVYLWGWFFLMPFGVAGYAIYLSMAGSEHFGLGSLMIVNHL